MIPQIVKQMIDTVKLLKQNILDDIEDVKQANHEKLLDRNDIKLEQMEAIVELKSDLNAELIKAVQAGENVDKYRFDVDDLETHLVELSELNTRLASIVLPVKEMYKDIIDNLTEANGGSLLEVTA